MIVKYNISIKIFLVSTVPTTLVSVDVADGLGDRANTPHPDNKSGEE
jgi:hypothetical protein